MCFVFIGNVDEYRCISSWLQIRRRVQSGWCYIIQERDFPSQVKEVLKAFNLKVPDSVVNKLCVVCVYMLHSSCSSDTAHKRNTNLDFGGFFAENAVLWLHSHLLMELFFVVHDVGRSKAISLRCSSLCFSFACECSWTRVPVKRLFILSSWFKMNARDHALPSKWKPEPSTVRTLRTAREPSYAPFVFSLWFKRWTRLVFPSKYHWNAKCSCLYPHTRHLGIALCVSVHTQFAWSLLYNVRMFLRRCNQVQGVLRLSKRRTGIKSTSLVARFFFIYLF